MQRKRPIIPRTYYPKRTRQTIQPSDNSTAQSELIDEQDPKREIRLEIANKMNALNNMYIDLTDEEIACIQDILQDDDIELDEMDDVSMASLDRSEEIESECNVSQSSVEKDDTILSSISNETGAETVSTSNSIGHPDMTLSSSIRAENHSNDELSVSFGRLNWSQSSHNSIVAEIGVTSNNLNDIDSAGQNSLVRKPIDNEKPNDPTSNENGETGK